MAIPLAIKNRLRAEWGAAFLGSEDDPSALTPHPVHTGAMTPRLNPEYAGLLPVGLHSHESSGLGLPLQLTFAVESFVKRAHDRGWFHSPQASQLSVQVNALTDAYSKMETIILTPVPVAYLIHNKQVLALFGCVLPFALAGEMGWLAVALTALVCFTLYGIEGIGGQLEDPFGYDRNDIKMKAVAEDCRIEVGVMLEEWRRAIRAGEGMVECFHEDRLAWVGLVDLERDDGDGYGDGD